jgi:hypothetical protein
MLAPTTAELHNAIQVLKKLGDRIHNHAAHMVMQLPETGLGDRHAAQIEARTIEQAGRIEAVIEQLRGWRDELLEQRKQNVSQSV